LRYISKRPILDRKSESVKESKEITGNVAYPGHAKGRVRIVKTEKDNSKFAKGDILVLIMTTPNLTPSMSKAAAIITDEGGITCHAAIFAREMKKPCIIGTHIATKALKDGDLIEVDADIGLIRVLKRANTD
jgi:pyruvate,water dikinase